MENVACTVDCVPNQFRGEYLSLTMKLGEAALALRQAELAYQEVLRERIAFVERVRYGDC